MSDQDKSTSESLADQIQALPPKERLEALKLQAEIRSLKRSRIKDPTFWRDLVGILAVVGTVVYSAVNFVDHQQSKQKFEVTHEVITLVEKLHDKDVAVQESAAILLSAWGEQALPLLLRSVSLDRTAGSSALRQALELIGREKPRIVLDPLRNQTTKLFLAVMHGDAAAVDPLLKHILLLGELASLGQKEESRRLLEGFSDDLGCGGGDHAGEVISVDQTAICEDLDVSLEKLKD